MPNRAFWHFSFVQKLSEWVGIREKKRQEWGFQDHARVSWSFQVNITVIPKMLSTFSFVLWIGPQGDLLMEVPSSYSLKNPLSCPHLSDGS